MTGLSELKKEFVIVVTCLPSGWMFWAAPPVLAYHWMVQLTTVMMWFGPTAQCGSGGMKRKPPL